MALCFNLNHPTRYLPIQVSYHAHTVVGVCGEQLSGRTLYQVDGLPRIYSDVDSCVSRNSIKLFEQYQGSPAGSLV